FDDVAASQPPISSYTVSTYVSGEGGHLSPRSLVAKAGAIALLAVHLDEGYDIASVTGCGGSLDGILYTTGVMTADCSVTAFFKPKSKPTYTVTADVDGEGGIISPPTLSLEEGATGSLTVTPDDSHKIADVTGCGGTLTGDTYTTGAMTNNCAVTARFEPKSDSTHEVTTSIDGKGGTITPSSLSVEEGTTASFTIVPDEHHVIDTVEGCDGTLTGNTYTT
ncbi:hypothetical protein ACW5XW_24545, partial [Aeromonas piscicola]